jgi:hypothetical protein
MKYLYLTSIAIFVSLTTFAIGPVTGPTGVCVGSTITLSDTSAGGSWSSSNPAVASVGSASGVVSGVSTGTATISYTIGASYATMTITAGTTVPAIYAVTAPSGGSYCAGGSGVHIQLSNSDVGVSYQLYLGSTPVSGHSLYGTGSVIDFGLLATAGTYSVSATGTTGCSTGMSGTVTVSINPLPNAYILSLGGSSFCAGSSGPYLTLSGSDPGVMYQLYLGMTPVGGAFLLGMGSMLSFGPVTTGGTYAAIGIDVSTGCTNAMTGSVTATVIPPPAPISGLSGVCASSTITLSDATPGGTWSSTGAAGILSIGSATGVVTGISAGTADITYTASTGCTVTTSVTVVTVVSPIAVPSYICTGLTATLSDPTPGGIWTSSNPTVAVIGSVSGIVSGVSAGSTTISYTVGGTCGMVTASVAVRLSPSPVSGITSICSGHTTTLSDAVPGGTWTSANTAVATINAVTGTAAGILSGTTAISYTNSVGCSANTVITVDSNAVISGPGNVCALDSISLMASLYGTWSSSNPAIARTSTYGSVRGISTGSAVISYAAYSTGCVSTHSVTVTSSCTGTPVAGTGMQTDTLVCPGLIVNFNVSGHVTACGTGFTWQSSPNGTTWTDMTYPFDYPVAPTYYRGKSTCYSTGLSSYTDTMHVSLHSYIASDTILNTPSYFCNGPALQLTTCGFAPGMNVTTYFGDGTSTNTTLYSNTMSLVHTYTTPGVYSIKHVLYMAGTAVDSTTSSFTYYYCRTLPVTFYFDANSNCVYDGGDQYNYLPVTTEIDSNSVPIDTVTSFSGFNYAVTGAPGTVYSFRVISAPAGLHVTCPSSAVLTDTIQSFVNAYTPLLFGLNCISSTNYDLSIYATMNCGRHVADGLIYISNSYCTPVSSTVTMNFSPKYTFSWSYPPPASVVGNTVTWNFSSLSVYNYYAVDPYIQYELSVPGLWLVTGDTVNANFKVTPYTSDVDTSNNYLPLVETVISSYDPNEISVMPAGKIIPCTNLKYTIEFENTGNDTARNISVLDTLSASLDAHSLKLVSSSAAMVFSMIKDAGYNIARFDFARINLADSSHHGHCTGTLTFNIRTKPGLSDGTLVSNQAGIYFDDNPAVMTNIVSDTIGMSPVTGPDSLCNGASILLSDATANGTWSRTNTAASVINGIVTALSAGIDTVNYTVSNSCLTRAASKTITIDPILIPSVSILSAAGMGDTVCGYVLSHFSALTVNGGDAPAYRWAVNGTTVDTGASYSYMPVNNDVISITLTSNASCARPATVIVSDTLTVLPALIPIVNISATPGIIFNRGDNVTFTAAVTNGGTMPTYQWLVNNIAVPGAVTSVYTTDSLTDNDSVSCYVTSNGECGGYATFNSVMVTVGTTGIGKLTANGLWIFPNPNDGQFTVKGLASNAADKEVTLEITDMLGHVVYKSKATIQKGNINEQIMLDTNIPKGLYMLNISSDSGRWIYRFAVE